MPVSPTPAQSEASRQNGACSHGPATPEGKARSALNGTRHGLRGATFALLPDEDPAEWAAHLDGYLARFRPADAAETRCVERLAACDWREGRLLRLETEMLFTPPADTTGPDPRLGWSRTLPRYAAAIRRDRKEALEQLEMLRASRPRLTSRPAAVDAARFRWLAERAERLAARPADVTPEPETRPGRSPSPRRPPPRSRRHRRTMSRLNPSAVSARSTAPSAGGSRPWPGGRRKSRLRRRGPGRPRPRGRGPGRRAGASAGAGVP